MVSSRESQARLLWLLQKHPRNPRTGVGLGASRVGGKEGQPPAGTPDAQSREGLSCLSAPSPQTVGRNKFPILDPCARPGSGDPGKRGETGVGCADVLPGPVSLSLSVFLGPRCLPGPQRPYLTSPSGRVCLTCSPSSGSVSLLSWSWDITVSLLRCACPNHQGTPILNSLCSPSATLQSWTFPLSGCC